MKIINFLKVRFRKWLNEEYWMEDYLKMGMKVGENCSINAGLFVDYPHCWLIEIKNNVTIAPQVYLLAHDASTKKLLNYTKIGKNSIVAAGSVVTKSVEEGTVVGGNPAKFITTTENLLIKNLSALEISMKYDSSFTISHGITSEMKNKMCVDLENNFGYVV